MKNNHSKHIHQTLKKHHPKATEKAKKLFRFKYPKLILLILSIIISYYIFQNLTITNEISKLNELSYLGIFIAGIFIAFGFSAPLAVGFLVVSHPQNIFLAALVGGCGAFISDYTIFKLIKFSFLNEFNSLKKETIKKIREITHQNIKIKIKHYILYLFAGILIATPLPDEIGISMLAGLTTIKPKIFAIMSFLLHTFFIFLLLLASS